MTILYFIFAIVLFMVTQIFVGASTYAFVVQCINIHEGTCDDIKEF